MPLRYGSALLLLLASCATTERSSLSQIAIPLGPLVAPKPIVLPTPMALPPVAPLVLNPEELTRKPKKDAQEKPRAQMPEQEESGASPQPEAGTPPSGRGPPPVATSGERPECEPIPTPHRGGDALHNRCADEIPPNRFPGQDVLVNGKRFDALQVGKRVLWEIKTDRFDTYTRFLRNQVITDQLTELRRERDLARDCGYDFVVGVSSTAHKAALTAQEADLHVVVTECR